MTWQGAFSTSASYNANDAVQSAGSSFIAKRAVAASGNAPVVGADWDLVAQAGTAGSTGPAGPAGPAGAAGSSLVMTTSPMAVNFTSQNYPTVHEFMFVCQNNTTTVSATNNVGFGGMYVFFNIQDITTNATPTAYLRTQVVVGAGATSTQNITCNYPTVMRVTVIPY